MFLQLQRTKIRIQGAGTSKSTSVQAWLVCVFGRSYPLRVETLLIFKFLHTSIYSRKWYRKYATCTVRGGNYCTFCNASPCMYIIHVLIYGGSHKKSLKWALFSLGRKKEFCFEKALKCYYKSLPVVVVHFLDLLFLNKAIVVQFAKMQKRKLKCLQCRLLYFAKNKERKDYILCDRPLFSINSISSTFCTPI